MKDKPKEHLIEEVKKIRQRITELELTETELQQAVNEKANIFAALSSGEDITEHKRIDEALYESKELYRKVFQQSVEAIYMFDPETKHIVETNNAFLDLLGYKKEETLTLTLYDFVVHKRENIDIYINHILTSEAIIIAERIWRRKDKTLVDVQISASKIKQREKDICFVVARNITEQKQAEEALRKSEERYRTLVENIDLGITLIDANYKIVTTNAAHGRLFNKPDSEFVGKECYREFEKREAVCSHCPGTKAMTTGQPAYIETAGVRDDGSRFLVGIHAFPLAGLYGEITGFIEVVEDITERKKAEEELLAAKERLETLSKSSLKTLENERRNIARELHDEIGQELTALTIHLEDMRYLSNSTVYMNHIKESLNIVQHLIQKVRNLSFDLRPPILDDLGLVPALRWYFSRLEKEAGLAIHFITNFSDHKMPADIETACFRVVQEALTNVVRHAKARQVTVELKQEEKELQLTISDDGIGFYVKSAQKRALLGESFGLLGMQERVQLVGGTIEIESMLLGGTKIVASFSLSES